MPYDTKCYELAEAFLDDTDTQDINTKANVDALSQLIQDTIETFIMDKHEEKS